MNKKFLVGAIVATMACMSMVGCGRNNSESRVVEMAPGMSIVATGNQGAFTMEGESNWGVITIEDVFEAHIRSSFAEDEQATTAQTVMADTEEETEESADMTEAVTEDKEIVVLDNDACKVVFKGAEDAGASEYSETSKCYNVTYEITNKLDREVVCFFNQEVLGAGETMTVTDRYDTWYEKNSDIKAYALLDRVEGEDNEKVILTRGFGEVSENSDVAFNFAITVNVNTLEFVAE